jgi:DNA-binding CsgD family transcriptional regulator
VTEVSPRELECLLTYARIGDYEEAAKELGIARSTFRNHLVMVREKLGVESTIQALWAVLGEEKAA